MCLKRLNDSFMSVWWNFHSSRGNTGNVALKRFRSSSFTLFGLCLLRLFDFDSDCWEIFHILCHTFWLVWSPMKLLNLLLPLRRDVVREPFLFFSRRLLFILKLQEPQLQYFVLFCLFIFTC